MMRKLTAAIASFVLTAMMAAAPAFAAAATLPAASVKPLFAAEPVAVTLNTSVQKFKTDAKKYYDDYGFSSNHYKYTAAELRMLASVIYTEAAGEPYACKLAVGNVVMNRVLSPGYPGKTIAEVVTRPNQFAYNPKARPNAECIRAATDVLKYETWVVPQNTYFFRATSSKANWGSHAFCKIIGHTAFYRGSYSGRYNGSAVPQKLYRRVYKWPQYGCAVSRNVKKVQVMLTSLGFKSVQDGWFGTDTKTQLVKFQRKYGLAADGVAGPATLKKLITKYGLSKYLKLK